MTTGQVVTIHTVRERDGVAEARPETTVRSDFGLEGDWRSRSGSPRQVTLIDEEWLQATGARLGYPVPPGATRRQVTVRGLPLRDLVGKTLQAGDVLLAVTEPCDPCENMNRKIGEGAREAMQGWGGVSARVVQGGTLRAGDAIAVREARAPASEGAERPTWEGVGTGRRARRGSARAGAGAVTEILEPGGVPGPDGPAPAGEAAPGPLRAGGGARDPGRRLRRRRGHLRPGHPLPRLARAGDRPRRRVRRPGPGARGASPTPASSGSTCASCWPARSASRWSSSAPCCTSSSPTARASPRCSRPWPTPTSCSAPGGVILIRDMILYDYTREATLGVGALREKVVAGCPEWVVADFVRHFGPLDTLRPLNHLLLKYWYVENWARECPEHYVPVSFEDYARVFRLLGMAPQVVESSTIPFLREKWKADFGLTEEELAPLRSTGILVAQKT